jgi:hypothetical protein
LEFCNNGIEVTALSLFKGVIMKKNGASEKLGRGKGLDFSRIDLHIPFLAGRPQRDYTIDQDDLTNLQIAFYTCKSLEDFFSVT